MAASKITYDDKVQGQTNPAPSNQKYEFGDANEVKAAINTNADLLDFAPLKSGLITGGTVTVNGGDNTLFDIAAGTGVILNWTDPQNPVRTLVTFGPFLAQTIPDISSVFTALYVNAAGTLVKASGTLQSPQVKRINILLQSVVHTNSLNITSITCSNNPAYESIYAVLDYISAAGAVNVGNQYTANGANLNINKSQGTTTLPFINRCNDEQNPTTKTNLLQTPVANITETFRDGEGGYIFQPASPVNDIAPDFYDDGSGTLAAVPNNRWSIKRIYFFGVTDATTITYGQAIYTSLSNAKAAIFTESIDISPLLNSGVFESVLVIKKGTTDLSDASDAEFIKIAPNNTGGTTVPITEFPDNTFKITESADPTKIIDFDASAIATATTRTITVPDENITLISEAPQDGNTYGRKDGGWVILP